MDLARKYNLREYLGRGRNFPFKFTRRTGGVFKGTVVARSDEILLIEHSLMQILRTMVGTRFMRRDFGSLLKSIVFDPNDPSLDVQIDYMIRTAIETWEPRVIVGPITIDRAEWGRGRIEITVEFTIVRSHKKGSIVFPFFLSEEQRKAWVTPAA